MKHGQSSVSSGSVFDYTMSRSSGLKGDTPYAQRQRKTAGLAESMKDDEYMMMKRMNGDAYTHQQQLRKLPESPQVCTMCGQKDARRDALCVKC